MSEEDDVIANRLLLVNLLKSYPVILEKSMLPKMVAAREKAWELIKDEFINKTGKPITIVQLKKLLNNMKQVVKKKTDLKATGNKPISISGWEQQLFELLQNNENPVYCKVPGSLSIGVGLPSMESSIDTHSLEEVAEHEEEQQPTPLLKTVIEKKKLPKKRKLNAETDETANLTTGDLQRLLLIEQIRLTRLKIKREEMNINKETREADNKQNGEGEKFALGEFLVL